MTDYHRPDEETTPVSIPGHKQCPQCGSVLTLKSYGGHMRKAHNVYGGFSGRIRNDKRYNRQGRKPNQGRGKTQTIDWRSREAQKAERRPAPAPPAPNGLAPGTLITQAFNDKLRVGLDETGGIWICERVR